MSRKPARIIVLGRSKNRSKQLKNFLSEIFTQEIPAKFVNSITIKYTDNSVKEIDYIEEKVVLDDLYMLSLNKDSKDSNKFISEIEIMVELDLISKTLKGQSKKLLKKYFEED